MTDQEAVLDTSVWVALFHDDPRTDALPVALGARTAVVNPVILAEIASLAERGRLTGDPISAVRAEARLEALTVDDAVEGGRLHGRLRRDGHPKVSLADGLILATARRLGAHVLTLDSDLESEPDVEQLA